MVNGWSLSSKAGEARGAETLDRVRLEKGSCAPAGQSQALFSALDSGWNGAGAPSSYSLDFPTVTDCNLEL